MVAGVVTVPGEEHVGVGHHDPRTDAPTQGPEPTENGLPEWVVSMTCGMLTGLLDRRLSEPRIGGLDYRVIEVSPPGHVLVEVMWPADSQRTYVRRWRVSIDVQAAV